MPFTTITKPTVGEATKKTLVDALIDNDTFLNGQLATGGSDKVSIVNGSFEVDGDASGVPDGWTKVDFTGGTFSITGNGLTDTVCHQGARAVKYVHPGGGGNGGGTITSTEFEVHPLKTYSFSWVTYSTAATLYNIVSVQWFDSAKASISTVALSTISANNPSAWAQQGGVATPPSTARFAKIIFAMGDPTGTTGGIVYLDAVSVSAIELSHSVEFEGTGTTAKAYTWDCPTGVTDILVVAFGGGGGGGGCGAAAYYGGGGGGGGEMTMSWVHVVPGTQYAISVGGGGGGGGGGGYAAAGAGQDTTFATTVVVAKGGARGELSSVGVAGAGGSGGTGGTGTAKITGTPGTIGGGGVNIAGGNGGSSVSGCAGGRGVAANGGDAPFGSKIRGAGGGGTGVAGAPITTVAGNGGPGSLIIRY